MSLILSSIQHIKTDGYVETAPSEIFYLFGFKTFTFLAILYQ